MTIYREELKRLLTDCEKYKNHLIGTEYLKNSVWQTAQTIISTDEQDLRVFLQQAEGQLDIIQFTCEDIFSESLKIVSDITKTICSATGETEPETGHVFVKLDNGEIQLWTEPDSGFFIKTVAESGEPVRLSGEEARRLAKALETMADKADKACRTAIA